jgi:hypothetical protein
MLKMITIAALMLPLAAVAAEKSGLSFQHNDWQLVCDNTRTCRAAGYQHEEGEEVMPMSVLLTRKAGPREPVTAELQLGTASDNALDKLPPPVRLTLRINGRSLGQVVLDAKTAIAPLPADQTAALLAALPRSGRIEWRAGDSAWRLSDKGAAAVLLKMDEFQGRVGTVGAIVRKGAADESAVRPPVPAPVVRVRVPEGKEETVGVPPALYEALRATVAKGDDCHTLTEREIKADQVRLTRLNGTLMLATVQCWMAAYNMGHGFWVVQASPPYRPVLVTAMGSDHSDGRIYANHKGRGIGDCWSTDEWVWDGARFVHVASATTGLCRMVAAGGAWVLPTLVTEVK